mgnify:CR=1 FL=1
MAGLDVPSGPEMLGEEVGVNILRLFAPDDLRDDLGIDSARLPELTLREHHMLTLDSAASFDQPATSRGSPDRRLREDP